MDNFWTIFETILLVFFFCYDHLFWTISWMIFCSDNCLDVFDCDTYWKVFWYLIPKQEEKICFEQLKKNKSYIQHSSFVIAKLADEIQRGLVDIFISDFNDVTILVTEITVILRKKWHKKHNIYQLVICTSKT